MDHPLPWLKYVDAGDLDDDRIDFDGLNVESPTGEHLGDVEGFIVDNDNGRPYYVVVDAGGWFKSRNYLLPIGQARLDADRDALVADLTRDRIDRFPGFDKDEFDRLDADGIRRFNDQTSTALTGGSQVYADTDHFSTAWTRPEFRQPDWWRDDAWTATSTTSTFGTSGTTSRLDDIGRSSLDYGTPSVADLTRPVDRGADIRASETVARDLETATRPARDVARSEGNATVSDRTREIDPSPYHDGRAQPGDVLGLETGGESTHIGETAEDENERRRDAERDASKQRE